MPTSTGQKVWTKSVIRWAGSKRKLLPTLLACLPEKFERYIEPFAGSACYFFATHPKRAVLGDINGELLRTYQVLRQHPRLVFREIASIPVTLPDYYRVRAMDPDALPDIGRAARFIYLTRNSFNGVYRLNRSGRFNVPMGVRTGDLGSEQLFYRCSVALRSAEFREGDFEACLSDLRTGDFIYLDPPYAQGLGRFRGEYGYKSFSKPDLPRLWKVLCKADRVGAIFILSYADTALVEECKRKWYARSVQVRRHIAGFAEDRRQVNEVLITNRPAVFSGLPKL